VNGRAAARLMDRGNGTLRLPGLKRFGELSMSKRCHILAFEPFDAGSHRAVRESIARHSRHGWTWLVRPGRYWKWRMCTAAIEMIEDARQGRLLDRPCDVIVVSSLMSAADVRAMLPGELRSTPMALLMHENQAAYPAGHVTTPSAQRDLQFPLTNLTSVLAADMVIWNSRWNRDSFLDGIENILRLAPDAMLPHDWRDRIEARSRVVWPPVEWPDVGANQVVRKASIEDAVRVVWPHRWEHDKGPDELLELARLHTESLNLRWTILGERYRTMPPAIKEFEREFADRIDHMGYEPDRAVYLQRLASCDWVLSTARHEFFGIAVVEAMLAGCLPWLPDRLSYPELLPDAARGLSPRHPPTERDAVALRGLIRQHLGPAIAPNAVARLDAAMDQLAARSHQGA
jgi:glycosyltransferase involved in cell wall biosynthesis